MARRRSASDRRAYTLRLTPKGRQKLTAIRPALDRVDEQILGMTPARQRQAFMQALSALIEACEMRRSM